MPVYYPKEDLKRGALHLMHLREREAAKPPGKRASDAELRKRVTRALEAQRIDEFGQLVDPT